MDDTTVMSTGLTLTHAKLRQKSLRYKLSLKGTGVHQAENILYLNETTIKLYYGNCRIQWFRSLSQTRE